MESQEVPCCAARERSDRRSAKLQPLGFSFLNLQKEQFFLQEHAALLGSFPPRGYKICSQAPARQPEL